MSNPFVLNRDVIQTGGFAVVTASLAPSFWGDLINIQEQICIR